MTAGWAPSSPFITPDQYYTDWVYGRTNAESFSAYAEYHQFLADIYGAVFKLVFSVVLLCAVLCVLCVASLFSSLEAHLQPWQGPRLQHATVRTVGAVIRRNSYSTLQHGYPALDCNWESYREDWGNSHVRQRSRRQPKRVHVKAHTRAFPQR